MVTSLYTSVKDRLSSWILLDSDSRYYLACSVKAPIAGHVCAVIGQTPLAASYLISTLLVFHLAAHFNVEVSSRDTGQARTWETCGMVCWRKSAFSWPLASRLFLGLLTSLFPGTIRRLAPPMAVHVCLQLVVVLGSSTSQIDVSSQQSCSQLYRTALGSAVYPWPLVSWHRREAPRRRTEAAWKCSASHNGIQARQVGE